MNEEMLKNCGEDAENTLPREISGEVVLCEAAGDFVLPDYQPEIRKILSVRPVLMPAGQYISPAKAEFSGAVAHTVLYTDNEGKLASVSLAADYEFSIPLPEDTPCTVVADSMPESCTCRPGGPRKLSLRTRVRNNVHVGGEESAAPEIRGMGSAEDSASLERLCGRFSGTHLFSASSGEFDLTDTLRVDPSESEVRAVYAGGNLLVNECREKDNACLCRGEAWVRCLLVPEGSTPYTVRTKIPFEQLVAFDEDLSGAQFTACGRVTRVDVSQAESESGETSLTFDVAGEIEVTAAKEKTVSPTLDIYSTAYEMNKTYRPLKAEALLGTAMGNYTISGTRQKSECDAEDAATVVDADGRVEVSSVAVEHGRCVVSGTVHTQLIFSLTPGEEGGVTLQAADIPVPFRVETDLRMEEGVDPRLDCRGELIAARGRIEANALAADCEIALSLRATEKREITVLAEAEPDRSAAPRADGKDIFVCYPQEGETLWQVASRYHCRHTVIAERNGLGEHAAANPNAPESLDGVHHLLIGE